jgi:hypothetical protein
VRMRLAGCFKETKSYHDAAAANRVLDNSRASIPGCWKVIVRLKNNFEIETVRGVERDDAIGGGGLVLGSERDLKKQRQQKVLDHIEQNKHGDKSVALNLKCKQPLDLAIG